MLRNVEVKARVRDVASLRQQVEALADAPCVVLQQDDTFFRVPRGRLKLRVLSRQEAELIYYERPDVAGPKECRYIVAKTQDAQSLRRLLLRALPVLGRVCKRRSVYLVGQTRVHLDEVEGLGEFVELEVVLRHGQKAADGVRIARRLMRRLGIAKADLLAGSYFDLLDPRQSRTFKSALRVKRRSPAP